MASSSSSSVGDFGACGELCLVEDSNSRLLQVARRTPVTEQGLTIGRGADRDLCALLACPACKMADSLTHSLPLALFLSLTHFLSLSRRPSLFPPAASSTRKRASRT